MQLPKMKNHLEAEEARVQTMGAAADRIGDLLDKYQITPEEIEAALEKAAQMTLEEMYPSLAAEASKSEACA